MSNRQKSAVLWGIQGLLAALFLFAGISKLVLPAEALKGPIPLPIGLLRFVGVAETAGALGLILPGIFHIRQVLTPIAAAGLVLIMAGATTITVETGPIAGASVPLIVGLLSALVMLKRWRHFA